MVPELFDPYSLDSRTSGQVFASFDLSSFFSSLFLSPCFASDSVHTAKRSFLSFFRVFLLLFLLPVFVAVLRKRLRPHGQAVLLVLFQGLLAAFSPPCFCRRASQATPSTRPSGPSCPFSGSSC